MRSSWLRDNWQKSTSFLAAVQSDMKCADGSRLTEKKEIFKNENFVGFVSDGISF